MAQTVNVTTVVAAQWTRLDSLAAHTIIEIQNKDATQSLGVVIAGGDPGGAAWDTGRKITPGGDAMWRLGATDQVWGRMEAGANAAGVLVQEAT
jgi:hypothetical protein